MADLTMGTVRTARSLTPEQRRVLRSLMHRKFYDLNQPEQGRRYPILFRAFIPADHEGNPTVILVCQHTHANQRGEFDFCVYSDGLYGKGHYASDKFGFGDMKKAREAFEEHLINEVVGVWPWVLDRVRKEAEALAKQASP